MNRPSPNQEHHTAAGGRETFDEFADEYDAEVSHVLKDAFGGGNSSFISIKAAWLVSNLYQRPLGSLRVDNAISLLDYGCGTGVLFTELQAEGFSGRLFGCDVSQGMLDQAANREFEGEAPELQPVLDGRAGYDDAQFDVIVTSAVLHHVDPARRRHLYEDVQRLLKPGGRFVVFEHNPFNPLTQLLVRTLPLDADAILLPASEVRNGMLSTGFADIRSSYIVFFPPRFRFLWRLESWLRWVPLGGQYAVTGEKRSELKESVENDR